MTKGFNLTIKALILFCVGFQFLVLMPGDCYAEEKKVAVIYSRVLGPYEQAFSGFKAELRSQGRGVSYEIFDLQKQAAELKHFLLEAKPELVFAIGTEAALYSQKNIKHIPVVFSMVLNPIENGVIKSLSSPGSNITGVSLNISVKEQFKAIKRISPNTKKVGMLYGAKDKEWLKNMAEDAAKREGLELLAHPIYSETGVLVAVKDVCENADFLWAAVDPLIYNKHSVKHILLITLRHKKPFMAFSSHYVKAGALMALECDYGDVGSQAAEIAGMIFGGDTPGVIPVRSPRKIRLVINYRTARTIGMEIPESIDNGTSEVVAIR